MASKFEEGKVLFEKEQFAESQQLFKTALAEVGDSDAALTKQINMWIRKCGTHLVPESSPAAVPAPTVVVPVHVPSSATSVRFEWFQTLSHVTFTFYVKNRAPEDVRLTFVGDRHIEVTLVMDAETNREYQHTCECLFAAVNFEDRTLNVRPMKVEISFPKVVSYHWPTLEVKPDDVVVAAAAHPSATAAVTAPQTAKQLAYPNSKGKDWSKVQLEEKEPGEAEEKPSGDHALNELFKSIYGKGTDEQRRAMMKSFQESNGTVLSTNWEEVGSKKVTSEPPKGMELVRD